MLTSKRTFPSFDLLGLNGSGKSTLLSALCGSLSSTGEALWEGQALSSLPPKERAKRITLLPQQMPTPPFSVKETVLCGRAPYMGVNGRPSAEDLRIAETVMKKTGVAHLSARLMGHLSGGERQLAFLAMALAQKTPLLLLDEPTSFLDKAKEKGFWEVLRRAQKEENITVLAAMHDLTAAFRVADRFLLLSEGRVLFHGHKEGLTDLLERHFGVRCYLTEEGPVFV
ncbi:MAG: ABC transporter ATP-binding protein [Clostridia bacterium]|nr:ABC transporter ATP-binding protein [Clostridia bacterium]